jgi:non-specific protein-tyrosine kinase
MDRHEGSDFRRYADAMRRRKYLILVTTLVLIGASLALSSLQTPIYEAKANLILAPSTVSNLFSPSAAPADQTGVVGTAIQVIKSEPVAALVGQRIRSTPRISATQVGQTDVIQLSAKSSNPKLANETVNAYADAYVAYRNDRASQTAISAAQQVQAKINDLQKQIDQMDARLVTKPGAPVDQGLVAQRDALVSQQSLFKQRLDQLQVTSALQSADVQAVPSTSPPSQPVQPRPLRNVLLAAALGLVVGAILALVLESLDDAIHSKHDLEHVSAAVPTLGFIPLVGSRWRRGRDDGTLVSRSDPTSPAAEAYRTLRTSIRFLDGQRPVRIVQITSPAAGEGKTTTAVNLAWALSSAGQRVILVDCDLRKPKVQSYFALSTSVGFSSVVRRDAALSEVIHPVAENSNLMVVPAGPVPPDPAELLSSDRAAEVLEALANQADTVVIDSSPLIPVADPAVLASHADATLVVVAASKTTAHELRRALEILTQVGAPVVGWVFNGVTARTGYGYSSYYHRYESELADRTLRGPAASA